MAGPSGNATKMGDEGSEETASGAGVPEGIEAVEEACGGRSLPSSRSSTRKETTLCNRLACGGVAIIPFALGIGKGRRGGEVSDSHDGTAMSGTGDDDGPRTVALPIRVLSRPPPSAVEMEEDERHPTSTSSLFSILCPSSWSFVPFFAFSFLLLSHFSLSPAPLRTRFTAPAEMEEKVLAVVDAARPRGTAACGVGLLVDASFPTLPPLLLLFSVGIIVAFFFSAFRGDTGRLEAFSLAAVASFSFSFSQGPPTRFAVATGEESEVDGPCGEAEKGKGGEGVQ